MNIISMQTTIQLLYKTISGSKKKRETNDNQMHFQ